MIRFFYAGLLRLHPARFRQRFSREMLWIFDEAAAHGRTAPLFADAVLSLCRQWTLRSEFWHQPDRACPAALDGVPVFYIGAGDTPRTSALIHGGLLSVIVFGVVCYTLSHSNSHGRLFTLMGSHNHSFSHLLETHTVSAAPTDLATQIKVKPEPGAYKPSPYFRMMPVLMALDSDQDGIISASEIANASVALLKLDKNGDNKLSAEECGLGVPHPAGAATAFMRLHPVLAALDANHDGEISASEILNAPAALLTLDKNRDGQLTEGELVPEPAVLMRSLPVAAR
jgi:Ca2+-binding EF-hand superfamily protein